MSDDAKFKQLLAKVEKLKASGNYDLSMEEDLSIAVMNLISLEEHFFMTSQKTGKDSYLDLLKETREVRKKLLGQMIDSHEGETWCISKHLLAATMRIMEVATKLQTDGKTQESKDMFATSYKIFSLFWAVRLKLIDLKDVRKKPEASEAMSYEDIMTELVNCCKE
jgi:hypothetical protein